jgi:hypothetical protein
LQANLGLKRAKQCEDFLALASWLAMKEPSLTTNIMKSQLSRLYGQLYAFQVNKNSSFNLTVLQFCKHWYLAVASPLSTPLSGPPATPCVRVSPASHGALRQEHWWSAACDAQ